MEKATVHSDQGMFVNLRGDEDVSSLIIERIPVDAVVVVAKQGEQWSKIKFKKKTGFVMNHFLVFGKEE